MNADQGEEKRCERQDAEVGGKRIGFRVRVLRPASASLASWRLARLLRVHLRSSAAAFVVFVLICSRRCGRRGRLRGGRALVGGEKRAGSTVNRLMDARGEV